MIRNQEPFKTIMSIFNIFGFNPKEITNRRKVFSVSFFIAFGLGFWFFVALSLIQSESLSDMISRSLYAATVVELIFKTFIIYMKMAHITDLFTKLGSIYEGKDEKVYFEKARKTSMRLAIFQFFSVAPSVLIPILKSLYSGKLLVPLYQFDNFKCSENGFYLCLGFETFGVTYLAFLVCVLDLLPICFMMMISEYFRFLNEKIRNLDLKNNHLAELLNCVKCHEKIKT